MDKMKQVQEGMTDEMWFDELLPGRWTRMSGELEPHDAAEPPVDDADYHRVRNLFVIVAGLAILLFVILRMVDPPRVKYVSAAAPPAALTPGVAYSLYRGDAANPLGTVHFLCGNRGVWFNLVPYYIYEYAKTNPGGVSLQYMDSDNTLKQLDGCVGTVR